MIRLLPALALAAGAAASGACTVRTFVEPNLPYPPDPPVPLCLYASTAVLSGENLTSAAAAAACADSLEAPAECYGGIQPLVSFTGTDFRLAFDNCGLLEACSTQWVLTPTFRYTRLQNTLQSVVTGSFWTQSDVNGTYQFCGTNDAASFYLFADEVAANCSASLPVLCVCVEPYLTPSPTAVPTRRPTRSPTRSPRFAPSLQPVISPSFRPSFRPSYSPTFTPTINVGPTSSPSRVPSSSPTASPS